MFTHPRPGRLRKETHIPCTKFQDYTFCARLSAFCIALWALCLTQFCFAVFSSLATTSELVVCDSSIYQHNSVTGIRQHVPSAQLLIVTTSSPDNTLCGAHQSALVIKMLLVMSGQVEQNPGPLTERNPGPEPLTLEDLNKNILKLYDQLTNIRHDIRSIRKDVEQNQMSINDLWSATEEGKQRCNENIDLLSERIDYLERKNEYQERYSRRENIILKGISGSANEHVKEKVVNVFNSVDESRLWKAEDFQRAHRLGSQSGRLGHIIVRFVHFEVKLKALKLRSKLGDKSIRLTNDLTQNQRNQLADLRHENKRGYFKGNRLIIENAPSTENISYRASSVSNAGASGGGDILPNTPFVDPPNITSHTPSVLSLITDSRDTGHGTDGFSDARNEDDFDYNDGRSAHDFGSSSLRGVGGGRGRGGVSSRDSSVNARASDAGFSFHDRDRHNPDFDDSSYRGGGVGSRQGSSVSAGISSQDRDRDLGHSSRRGGGSGDRQHVINSSQNSLPRRGAGRGRSGRPASELHSRDSRGGARRLDSWLQRGGTSSHRYGNQPRSYSEY